MLQKATVLKNKKPEKCNKKTTAIIYVVCY